MDTTAQDITHRLERIMALEHRLGIQFDALSAFLSRPDPDGDYQVEVNGELQPLGGETLERSIVITITIYDAHKRVIATTDMHVDKEQFFLFEAFSISSGARVEPAQIKLYPRAWS
jgi:hypothetical protein